MQSCGVDFTGRPNHIAHHLIFREDELPACPPAAIFTLWKGWRSQWTKPRYLGEWDRVNYENEAQPFNYSTFSLPAKTWFTYTNDEGCAVLPLESDNNVTYPLPEGKEDALVWLFFETQSLMQPAAAWKITFTNFLTENDNPQRYNWIGLPTSNSPTRLSFDSEILDVFSNTSHLVAPESKLAQRARTPAPSPEVKKPKNASTISIAPIEDSDYIQEELILEEDEDNLKQVSDLLEGTETLPELHPDETFDDIFASDDDGEKLVLPEIDFKEEEETGFPQRSRLRTYLPLLLLLGTVVFVVTAIFVTPDLIESINRTLDPAPVDIAPTKEEIEQKKRLEAVQMDPDSRFDSQIGEVGVIMQKGQFLLARAYLSRYRGDSERSITEDYQQLDHWFEQQKTILEKVNRRTGLLEKELDKKQVISSFDNDMAALYEDVKNLAEDLRPSLQKSLQELEADYQDWLSSVRLKTEHAPTFFIPISKENPNPEITFKNIPEKAMDWMLGLEDFERTSQIQHIQIQVSPFRGLNQFQLSSEDAINLTLWKESSRSLLSYLDGQTEVLQVIADTQNQNEVTFAWLFRSGEARSGTKSIASFPEPPLILRFLNTLTNNSLNVVMMGGVSQELATLAEIPLSFIRFDQEFFKFKVLDPVLKEKFDFFILPPHQFLQLRSSDNRYQFAWDVNTSDFHLYESRNLESNEVKVLQNQISKNHKLLTDLQRKQKIFRSVEFIKNTPLWSLGKESLGATAYPEILEDFGKFTRNTPNSYFEYLRHILIYFADTYTLIRPSVMEQWLAYPKNFQPNSKGSIYTYRNLLLRTSKRFRSLLDQKTPDGLEQWRKFVTNIEFWLLGEYQEQLMDVLSLLPEEIAEAQSTDIADIEQRINQTKLRIAELQANMDGYSDLSGIENVEQWVVEIASMEPGNHDIPLILFR